MRYYNNLDQFEEIRSFKRFYAEDPIPGVDVVVEKVPPGSPSLVGIENGKTVDDLKEDYPSLDIDSKSFETIGKRDERFRSGLEKSTKFSRIGDGSFDQQLTNLVSVVNKNALALIDLQQKYIDLLEQSGSNPIETRIIKSYIEDFFGIGGISNRLVTVVKFDLNKPQGIIEEFGWFYSETEQNPDNTINDGSIVVKIPGLSFDDSEGVVFSPFINFTGGSGLINLLPNPSVYYIRPYIKFENNNPVDFIFGDVIQIDTNEE